jgi:hypothetical protein
MKQTQIAAPAQRTEQAIVNDIALESERLGTAQQEIAAFEDRRAAMLATESLDKIHALADSHARAKLGVEIAQSRLDALNRELRLFYETEAQAAVDAELAPLAAIDAEERRVLADYETHATAVATDLAALHELDARRHQVSVAVHRLNGQWTPLHSQTCWAPITAKAKLPSAEGGPDHWPVPPRVILLDAQARAVRDAAALLEYRERE